MKLVVDNAPSLKKTINLHPTEKLGSRIIKTGKTFFVPKEDMQKIKVGDVFRLKDLFNVKIKQKDKEVSAEYAGDELITDTAKIQWTTDSHVEMKVFVPQLLFIGEEYNPESLDEVDGFAEDAVSNLKTGEIVQFERFGFVRIENEKGHLTGFFSHK
jgi:glutamyl-tRNA synthetase